MHQHATLDLLKLLARIRRSSGEQVQAWKQKEELTCFHRWTPPGLGQIKVNFDVAVRESFAVGAAVLRDSQGRIVGACVNQIQVAGPLEGEAAAAQIGVEEAIRRGFKNIILEGDSLLFVDSLRHFPARVDWSIYNRVDDIVRSLSSFYYFSF